MKQYFILNKFHSRLIKTLLYFEIGSVLQRLFALHILRRYFAMQSEQQSTTLGKIFKSLSTISPRTIHCQNPAPASSFAM